MYIYDVIHCSFCIFQRLCSLQNHMLKISCCWI